MSVRRIRPRFGLLALAALVVAACGGVADEPAAGDGGAGLHVVATTSILGDVVGELVGDAGTVTTLMQPGVDPHGFQASPRQAQHLREADLVVANGLQLEQNLLGVLAAAEADGARVLEVAPELDPISYRELGGLHDGGDGHADDGHAVDEHSDDVPAHGSEDPHVWLDASRMADAAELIAAELAAVDDTGEERDWSRRGSELAATYRDLDADIEQTLSGVPEDRRVLVTNHEALGYFAARYDFEIIGTVIPGASAQAEANPQQFGELAETVRDANVTAIFAETTESTRLAEALAREVGDDVEVVTLFTGSLGPGDRGAATYPQMMRTNARRIAQALTE